MMAARSSIPPWTRGAKIPSLAKIVPEAAGRFATAPEFLAWIGVGIGCGINVEAGLGRLGIAPCVPFLGFVWRPMRRWAAVALLETPGTVPPVAPSVMGTVAPAPSFEAAIPAPGTVETAIAVAVATEVPSFATSFPAGAAKAIAVAIPGRTARLVAIEAPAAESIPPAIEVPVAIGAAAIPGIPWFPGIAMIPEIPGFPVGPFPAAIESSGMGSFPITIFARAGSFFVALPSRGGVPFQPFGDPHLHLVDAAHRFGAFGPIFMAVFAMVHVVFIFGSHQASPLVIRASTHPCGPVRVPFPTCRLPTATLPGFPIRGLTMEVWNRHFKIKRRDSHPKSPARKKAGGTLHPLLAQNSFLPKFHHVAPSSNKSGGTDCNMRNRWQGPNSRIIPK